MLKNSFWGLGLLLAILLAPTLASAQNFRDAISSAAIAMKEALERELNDGALAENQDLVFLNFKDSETEVACQPLSKDLKRELRRVLRQEVTRLGTKVRIVDDSSSDAVTYAIGTWQPLGEGKVALDVRLADINGGDDRPFLDQPIIFDIASLPNRSKACVIDYVTVQRMGTASRFMRVFPSVSSNSRIVLHDFREGDEVFVSSRAVVRDQSWLVVQYPNCPSETVGEICLGFTQADLSEAGIGASTAAAAPTESTSSSDGVQVAAPIEEPEIIILGSAETRGPGPAALRLHTVPDGADVLIDGEIVGQTPWSKGGLSAGDELEIELDRDRFAKKRIKVQLRRGPNNPDPITLDPLFGTLSVNIEPAHANVIVRDFAGDIAAEGTVPFKAELDEDVYSLELSAAGHDSRVAEIVITRQQEVVIDDKSSLRPLEGLVVIDSDPAREGASVLVDGEYVGKMPLDLMLPAGERVIEIDADDLVGKQNFVVEDQGSHAITISLKPAKTPQELEAALILTIADWILIQESLSALGFDTKGVDGRPGANTRKAVQNWQRSAKTEQSGFLDSEQHELLLASAMPKLEAWRSALWNPGKVFRDCPNCPEMVVIPTGSFMMGSPESEEGRDNDEGPQHEVRIGYTFAVGRFEVTFAEWDACVDEGGCSHRPEDRWGRGLQPVMRVSWDDTREYLRWLSRKTGEAYRLLSEAEWEYVARAGTTTPYNTGSSISSRQANFGRNNNGTVKVETYNANAFGLHDVHGNVWEWTEDCYNDSYAGAPTNGAADESDGCSRRMLRGGSWDSNPRNLRSANRDRNITDLRLNIVGFRIARTL